MVVLPLESHGASFCFLVDGSMANITVLESHLQYMDEFEKVPLAVSIVTCKV